MPIAYSQHRIVNGSLRADTPAHTIADLEEQLILAAWALDRTVTGGAVYICTSPDPALYQAKLRIQDDISYHADFPHVDLYNFRSMVFQFWNTAETVPSFQHQIRTDNTFGSFQTVIGRAQVFISVPGHNGTAWSAVAGGIPAMPVMTGICVQGLIFPTIAEMWWTCGGSQWGFDWRTQANCYACMSHYLNGVVEIAPDNNNISPFSGFLCLFPLTSPDTYASGAINWPTITYSAHAVLNIDAFIGWQWNIRGQLWDAFLQTAGTTLDQVQSFTDRDASGDSWQVECITWHSDFYSSLQLITGVSGFNLGNQAY